MATKKDFMFYHDAILGNSGLITLAAAWFQVQAQPKLEKNRKNIQ